MAVPGRAEPVAPSEFVDLHSIPTEQSLPAADDLLESTIPKWAQSVPGIPEWAQSVLQPTKDSLPLDDDHTGWGTRPYRDSAEPQSPTWETVSHLSKSLLDRLLRARGAPQPRFLAGVHQLLQAV